MPTSKMPQFNSTTLKMKRIEKGKEPNSLTKHRAKGGDFDGLDKDQLRGQLISDQGFICCYCMKRIPEGERPFCKIEHVKSQKYHPDLQLTYRNFLIACTGNEGSPNIMQTCDTFKGEKDLSFNPSDKTRNIELFIFYLSNGEIRSNNPAIDKDLDEILNLNTNDLKEIRKCYYMNIDDRIKKMGSEYKDKKIPRSILEKERQYLLTKYENKFPEYCMVSVYLLDKKLRKYG
jgi:uncharacterized protein (TIGR02646 family)